MVAITKKDQVAVSLLTTHFATAVTIGGVYHTAGLYSSLVGKHVIVYRGDAFKKQSQVKFCITFEKYEDAHSALVSYLQAQEESPATVLKPFIVNRDNGKRVDPTLFFRLGDAHKYYGYTLQTGKDYQKEAGNKAINLHPATVKSLETNLNNAVNNAASNGCSNVSYSVEL
ncbi:MAG: hypothetical protein RR280_10310 [Bacteroidaceae bacterium]